MFVIALEDLLEKHNMLYDKLSRFVAVFPALILLFAINMLITVTIAGIVMLELISLYPGAYWPLFASIAVSVAVYTWLVFNHKLRKYVLEKGMSNE